MADRASTRRRNLLPAPGLVATGLARLRRRRETIRPGSPYLAGAPLLFAHRGGAALAPENTLLAFQRAVNWWQADALELDVRPTRDGEVVVFHDATLDRTTDGSGPVVDRSLDEIRTLDAAFHFSPDGEQTYPFRGTGVGIPTLGQVLHACSETRINIEIKDGRAQERVWEIVRDARASDRVLLAAGTSRNRARLNGYPVPVSAGKEELRLFVGQSLFGLSMYTPAVDAIQIPDRWRGRQLATPQLVQAAHARNIAVHVWTVDEVEDMERLLDWGVDGIMTDRPDRLARVLHARTGRPLPPGPPTPCPEPFLEYLLRN